LFSLFSFFSSYPPLTSFSPLTSDLAPSLVVLSMSGSGKIWRSSSAPKGNSTNPRPLMRAAASEIQKSARVAPLTCRYELAIFLHSFLNVDLFQQGDYAIRVTALLEGQQKLALPLRAIVSDELEQVDDSPDEELLPKISQDEGHYRCPRFFIRYKREEAAINQGALFRVEVPADRNIDAEPVLIRFELLYRKPAKGKEQINSPKLDDKRSQLDAVASHVFRLYLDTDAVSVSGRATFNEKHACALTWTAHAALLSFRHKTAPVLGKMDFKHYASQEGVVTNGGGGGESTASNMSTASAATKLENNGSDVRSRRTASLWHSIIHDDSSDSSDDEGEVAEDGQSTSSAALAMAMADASFMPSTLKTARVNKSDKGAKNGTADDSSQRRKGQKYDLDVGDTWLKTMDVIHWACQSALHSSFSSIHKIIQKLARDLLDDFPEVDMESQINFTSLADATVAEVYSAIVRDVEGVSIAVCLMWEKYVMVLRKRSSQVLSQLEKADNLRRVMRVQCCLYTDSVESDDSAMPIDRDKPRSRNRRRLRQRTVDRLKILPVPRLEDASYPETRHTRPIFVRQTAEAKGRDEARRRADLLKLRSPIGPSHARHFDEDGRGRVNSRHVVGEGGEKIGGAEFTAEDFGMAEDDPTPIVHLDEKKMVVDAKGEPELRQKQKLAPLHLHRHSQAGTMAGSSSQSQNGGMVGGLHAVIFVHGFQGCSFDLRMLRNRLSTLLPMGEDEAERGETPFYFHLASSNEGDSHASIEKMGYKLANVRQVYMSC